MTKKKEVEVEQLALFDVPEPVETFEQTVSRQAKEIFDLWYEQWYVGRYTQNVGHIIKIFKMALSAGVTVDDVFWAANILGREATPISEFSLQKGLGQVQREKKRQNASTDFMDKSVSGGYGEEL